LRRHRGAWALSTALLAVLTAATARAQAVVPADEPEAEPARKESDATPLASEPPPSKAKSAAAKTAAAAVATGTPIPPALGPPISSDRWTFFTTGRLGTFVSWAKGDGMPQQTTYNPETDMPLHQVLTNTGGTGSGDQASYPVIRADGTPSMKALYSKINSMRVRSGFTGDVLAFGARRLLGDEIVTAYLSVTSVVDSQAQKKYFQNLPDVREGYFSIEGSWGLFLAGRTGVLFNRGAVETDFLYLHGYGLGFPADLQSAGGFPTAGQIGFGVLANGYGAGFVYATPVIAGIRLWVGLYDPSSLTGSSIERTKYLRPESELVIDEPLGGIGKLHVYLNGGAQPNYQQNQSDAVVKWMYGVGGGARLELGPVHLAGGGHWGKGLGLAYPGLLSDAVYDAASNLRFTDGYFGMVQVVLGPFDLNGGYGKTTIHMTTVDLTADPANPSGDPTNSVIRTQAGWSAALVYHARDWLHFDVDVFHADSKWDLGERQQINFYNAGTTLTW
jgi:hypothetical protein